MEERTAGILNWSCYSMASKLSSSTPFISPFLYLGENQKRNGEWSPALILALL